MDKLNDTHHDSRDNRNLPLSDDDSGFFSGTDSLSASGRGGEMDFSALFSGSFSNILPLYRSLTGPTQIFTATRYGKRYVLKGLKEEYRDDPFHNLALAKEFEIGIGLDHPGIRRTVGLETVEGLGRVIVLEYIDGYTLEALLHREDPQSPDAGRLTKAEGRRIAAHLADTLGYLHSKQVLHRDLKPSNIIISVHGEGVKVIDFNLSDSDDYVVLKNPAGSRRYMAPELLTAGASPSVGADLYSLGKVMEDIAKATSDEWLARVAGKCVVTDPGRRPSSASLLDIPGVHPSLKERLDTVLASRTLTWVMLSICAVLGLLILFPEAVMKIMNQ